MSKTKDDLRIVYMGTPDFAVAGLKALIQSNFNVVGVITAPDRPSGRGRKLQASSVKKAAIEYGIPVLQPEKLRNQEFLNALQVLKADLQIVVAFRMLPKVVWQMPSMGTFNLHASLLPHYRGAAPINWALINGETKTGVSTFFIDEKIDTGALLLQEECKIDPEENAGSLHDKLMTLGAELIVRTVELIASGKADPLPQTENSALKEAPKIHKETCRINWLEPPEKIRNLIRGMSPYPGAWTSIVNGEQTLTPCKILAAQIPKELSSEKRKELDALSTTDQGFPLVQWNKELWVKHPEAYIQILEMQIPGKRKMLVRDLLNGWQPSENSEVE